MAGNSKPHDGLVCSICGGGFVPITEGGMSGEFGNIPVAFCSTCYAGVVDMVHQMYACPNCELTFEEARDEADG